MKIQYSNKMEDRIAYSMGLANAPKVEGYHLVPVVGSEDASTFYTKRDFFENAQIFSSDESISLTKLSHMCPNCTLIVID